MQKLWGLALVGETIEHVLPIALGGGANGKSTLTKIGSTVLGGYAVVCSKDIGKIDAVMPQRFTRRFSASLCSLETSLITCLERALAMLGF